MCGSYMPCMFALRNAERFELKRLSNVSMNFQYSTVHEVFAYLAELECSNCQLADVMLTLRFPGTGLPLAVGTLGAPV